MRTNGDQDEDDLASSPSSQWCGVAHQPDHEAGAADNCVGQVAATFRSCTRQPTADTKLAAITDSGGDRDQQRPIADTELSPYYLNLGYHPQFFFNVPDFDEERLPGQENLKI